MPISNLSNGLRTGVCTSTNRPTTPYEGQHIYETDTDIEYVWSGTAWVVNYVSAASPTFTGTPLAPTATTGTNTTQLATTAFANAAGGLVLITTCTATSTGSGGSYVAATASGGVVTVGTINTSVTVSSAFSTTYDNYRIVINAMAASVDGAQNKFTINGSTGSTYHTVGTNMDYGTATVYPVAAAAAAFCRIGETSLVSNNLSFDIYSPFLAATSFITSIWNTTNHVGWYNSKDTNAASSTAFTITPSSGTLTGGTIRVYGYRNS